MKKRKVFAGEVHHLYQRTRDKGLIFYCVTDYLVFLSIFFTQARKHGLVILSLCPMPDHFHAVLQVSDTRQLACFVQTYAHLYALEWNTARKRRGLFFQHPYGSAVKMGNKQVRTVLAYCNNNPVERKLTLRAEDYRWNLLPYLDRPHPYSPPLDLPHARSCFRRILQEVRCCHHCGNHLHFSQLERWSRKLTPVEKRQLADYIIGLWNYMDYQQAASYYGSKEAMIRAFHDNTGSEYDIHEERDAYSDVVYAECTEILLKEGLIGHVFMIPTLPDIQKRACYELLRKRTSARSRQILKYLHMPLNLCAD